MVILLSLTFPCENQKYPLILSRLAGLLQFPTLWLPLHRETLQHTFGSLFLTFERLE